MTGEIIRVVAIVITAAIFILIIRQNRPELGFMLTLAAMTAVLLMLVNMVEPVVTDLKQLFERGGVDISYFSVTLKCLGIAYITSFVADTCRDFGQTSLANKAELAGRCAVLALSLPLITAVLNIALELVGL